MSIGESGVQRAIGMIRCYQEIPFRYQRLDLILVDVSKAPPAMRIQDDRVGICLLKQRDVLEGMCFDKVEVP